MTALTTQIHVPLDPPADHRSAYVVAALDRTPVHVAVRAVGEAMARHLGVPLRELHVGGTSHRARSVASRLASVERGETTEVPGRPSFILSALVESPSSPLLVLGAPAEPRRSANRGHTGTTLAVARRVSRPVLVAPRALTSWSGPRRVLVPLDGTSMTAFCAAQAVIDLDLAAVTTTTAHVFYDGTVPSFWDQPYHEYEAWTNEFRARYVAPALEDGLVLRAGPRDPGSQLVTMLEEGGFDMVVAVWSQLAPGTKADVIFKLLANSPVPILLVPSNDTGADAGG